jgi:uridine kinase
MPPLTLVQPHLADLVARARALALAEPRGRRILGIAGPPGAGKSTLAAAVVEGLDGLAIRDLLDEAWYLASDAGRVERLIARHVDHGRTPTHARDWVVRSDEANARLVERTRDRADLVVEGLPRR